MRLLIIRALPAVLALILSCAPRGALTPRDAFVQVRYAYTKLDAGALETVLSGESIQRTRKAASLFSAMKDGQLEALSKHYGVPASRLRRMSVRDYLILHLIQERRNPCLRRAVRYNIMGIDRAKDRAVIRVENGMELLFVREGPYWKFELSSF